MQNTGIHHISVLSSSAKKAYDFYHRVLGLKLILKTVNQDEPSMYHLFFGDEAGRGGTEFTVFEMKATNRNVFGTNALERSLFLVPSEDALTYWEQRLDQFGVEHCGIEAYDDGKILRFEDEDGQRLGLVAPRQPLSGMNAYVSPEIEAAHAIQGIAAIHMRVRYPEATGKLLVNYFNFYLAKKFEDNGFTVWVYRNDDSDFQHEVHIIEDKTSAIQRLGVGGIHHVAFGVESVADLQQLQEDLDNKNVISSGIVDREFIVSSYFREPNYNLFEVATPLNKSPESFPNQQLAFDEIPLFLPEFLEAQRESIERDVNARL